MDRRTRVEWLRLLHGELPEPAARELREQIRSRPQLEQAFSELERRWQELEIRPPAPAPPGFATRVVAGARDRADAGLAPAWWKYTLVGKAATAAVLTAGILLGALLATPGESQEWDNYLDPEPTLAESYLSQVEASEIGDWPEDDS